jgi:predicted nucleic acid-binding protein
VIVVADASPIHYLVLIEAVDALQPLYTHVVVPESVAQELKQTAAPEAVQRWIARPPDWCEVRPDHYPILRLRNFSIEANVQQLALPPYFPPIAF